MELDPADPTQLRQTAFCAWCAVHRPDEDPRWPCSSARAEITIGQLLSALSRIAQEANAVQSEDNWGIYPVSLFRVIGHELAELREVWDLVGDQVLPDNDLNKSNEENPDGQAAS